MAASFTDNQDEPIPYPWNDENWLSAMIERLEQLENQWTTAGRSQVMSSRRSMPSGSRLHLDQGFIQGAERDHAASSAVTSLDDFLAVAPRLDNSNPATAQDVIVCQTIASIPPGRQPTRCLQCGICHSATLFDRKAELQRHMETHFPAAYPCTFVGCERGGLKGFKRTEHLRNHLRKIHGM